MNLRCSCKRTSSLLLWSPSSPVSGDVMHLNKAPSSSSDINTGTLDSALKLQSRDLLFSCLTPSSSNCHTFLPLGLYDQLELKKHIYHTCEGRI